MALHGYLLAVPWVQIPHLANNPMRRKWTAHGSKIET